MRVERKREGDSDSPPSAQAGATLCGDTPSGALSLTERLKRAAEQQLAVS